MKRLVYIIVAALALRGLWRTRAPRISRSDCQPTRALGEASPDKARLRSLCAWLGFNVAKASPRLRRQKRAPQSKARCIRPPPSCIIRGLLNQHERKHDEQQKVEGNAQENDIMFRPDSARAHSGLEDRGVRLRIVELIRGFGRASSSRSPRELMSSSRSGRATTARRASQSRPCLGSLFTCPGRLPTLCPA